jgi:hypothetical protein
MPPASPHAADNRRRTSEHLLSRVMKVDAMMTRRHRYVPDAAALSRMLQVTEKMNMVVVKESSAR